MLDVEVRSLSIDIFDTDVESNGSIFTKKHTIHSIVHFFYPLIVFIYQEIRCLK